MYIKEIEIKNFRNYQSFSEGFDPKVNIIIGENAQGKTNLLEGIFLSSLGRSFRTSHDSDLIRFGEQSAYVRVEAEKEIISTKVEIFLERGGKKNIKRDGNRIRKTSDLIDNIVIVVFSPEDLEIVKDEPEKRRKFIDRELAQIKPTYYENLSNYKRILQQRNAYLKEDNINRELLATWDRQLVSCGSNVIRMRKEFVDKINLFSGRIHAGITNGREDLEIRYSPNIPYEEDKVSQEEIFEEALRTSMEGDLRNRTTGRGPHKDDIVFFVEGINARTFGSQGQQRTCALSLKLAELDFIREETGESGILLLDDVMSELDEGRRKYLIKTLSENQLFITATDVGPEITESFPQARMIRIKRGSRVEE